MIHYPILLLDKPTAWLDETNRDVVGHDAGETRRWSGHPGIFHDSPVREAVRRRSSTSPPSGLGRLQNAQAQRAGPLIHTTAHVEQSLGRSSRSKHVRVSETVLEDIYVMQDCAIWCARIGKFADIAAAVRINATDHPTWRATLHHHLSRRGHIEGAGDEEEFFDRRPHTNSRSAMMLIGMERLF